VDPALESLSTGGHRQAAMALSVEASSNEAGSRHQFISIGRNWVAVVRRGHSPRPLQTIRPMNCRVEHLHSRSILQNSQ
jgi:hypothetical protein